MKKFLCFISFLFILSCYNNPFLPSDLINNTVNYVSSGPCDMDLSTDSINPSDAAHAIGICDGLVSAEWVLPDGSPVPEGVSYNIGHGILPDFGLNVPVREGTRLLVLATGTARRPGDNGFVLKSLDRGYTNNSPAGFPIYEADGVLPGAGHDGVALKVTMKMPEGVKGFSMDYKLYTYEYPEWLKTTFLDQCCVLLTSASGLSSGRNIMNDESGNPFIITSNTITVYTGSAYGDSELIGTGFETYGATRWITRRLTTADRLFKEEDMITIIFAIWDTGDGICDTTVLFDNFQWIAKN